MERKGVGYALPEEKQVGGVRITKRMPVDPPITLPGPLYKWRALTMNSPWGQLISDGKKPLENRPMNIVKQAQFAPGSWLAIHVSSSRFDDDGTKALITVFENCSQSATIANSESSALVTELCEFRHNHRNAATLGKGYVIAIARIGHRMTSTQAVATLPDNMTKWVDRDSTKGCIVWDVVLKLNTPLLMTSGQGSPFLTDAPVHLFNAKKEPKTKQQLEKARKIADGRKTCAEGIVAALRTGAYTTTRNLKFAPM